MGIHIVITGAPASGKTVFFERLKSEPFTRGFLFFDELARAILTEDPGWRDNWAAFHHEIYRRQVERERTVGRRSFISDRGTVDAFAFHPESLDQLGTTLEREYARYTAVIQLGSAAAIGPPYYVTDTIRNESVDEARKIERAITSVWNNHPGYQYIDAGVAFEVKYAAFRRVVMEHSIRVNI